MIEFTANDLHQKRQEVYKAALQGPVKIKHKFHGDFVMMRADERFCLLGDKGLELPEKFISGQDELRAELKKEDFTIDIDRSKGGVIEMGTPLCHEEGGKEVFYPDNYIFDVKEGDTPITEIKGDFYAADDSDDESGISVEWREGMSKKEFEAQFMGNFNKVDGDD